MDELIYSYKKGQGWVIGPAVEEWSIEYTTIERGTYRVTLYDRLPTLGDRYYSLGNGYDNSDGRFDWVRLWDALRPDMEYHPDQMGGLVIQETSLVRIYKNDRFVVVKTERIPV